MSGRARVPPRARSCPPASRHRPSSTATGSPVSRASMNTTTLISSSETSASPSRYRIRRVMRRAWRACAAHMLEIQRVGRGDRPVADFWADRIGLVDVRDKHVPGLIAQICADLDQRSRRLAGSSSAECASISACSSGVENDANRLFASNPAFSPFCAVVNGNPRCVHDIAAGSARGPRRAQARPVDQFDRHIDADRAPVQRHRLRHSRQLRPGRSS